VSGWNLDAVLERYRLLWPDWIHALRGTGTLGVDYTWSLETYNPDARSVPTDLSWAHNAVMSYAYVLARLAHGKQRLTVLDWGGGAGQFLPLSKALLPDLEFEYHVKDIPALCSLGRELNPEAVFYEDDSWQGRKYDLAISSSAFQFSEDWRGTLEALSKVIVEQLFISRIPIVLHNPSFVVLQRAETYLGTQFLGWFLNREEFFDCAHGAGLGLVREFVMLDQTPARGAPEQATYRGFLLRPATAR
jgi:putative methyltransferase (TIGR04325 family)